MFSSLLGKKKPSNEAKRSTSRRNSIDRRGVAEDKEHDLEIEEMGGPLISDRSPQELNLRLNGKEYKEEDDEDDEEEHKQDRSMGRSSSSVSAAPALLNHLIAGFGSNTADRNSHSQYISQKRQEDIDSFSIARIQLINGEEELNQLGYSQLGSYLDKGRDYCTYKGHAEKDKPVLNIIQTQAGTLGFVERVTQHSTFQIKPVIPASFSDKANHSNPSKDESISYECLAYQMVRAFVDRKPHGTIRILKGNHPLLVENYILFAKAYGINYTNETGVGELNIGDQRVEEVRDNYEIQPPATHSPVGSRPASPSGVSSRPGSQNSMGSVDGHGDPSASPVAPGGSRDRMMGRFVDDPDEPSAALGSNHRPRSNSG